MILRLPYEDNVSSENPGALGQVNVCCSGDRILAVAGISVRSERMLMKQLGYNLLLPWFVGREMDPGGVRTTRATARTGPAVE